MQERTSFYITLTYPEKNLPTLQEYMRSPPVCGGFRVSQSLDF